MINTIFILLVMGTLAFTIGMAYVIQTKMKSTKREYYVLFLFSAILYEVGYIFEMAANSTDGGFVATKIMYLGTMSIMPFYLMFLQKYCEIPLPKIVNIVIFASAVSVILLVWTSDWHTLYYTSYCYDSTGETHRLAIERGVLYPLGFIHAIVCVVIAVVILFKKMRLSAKVNRLKHWILLFGAIVPISTYVLYFTKLNFYGADYASIFLCASTISIYRGVVKHDLMENEETVRTQNWLREMIGRISHEMKTPLTVIATDIQLAEKFVDDGNISGAKELMREAWQETMQTANLVTDSLTFSRGQDKLKPMEHFNAGAILEATLALFEPSVKKHGNTLVREIAKPTPMHGSADMLSVALVNLLSNANRHTKAGVIKVRWALDDDRYRLTVSDNGSGIAPELLPQIFERGVSGGNSTGLGLAIVKNAAELHGGEITVESEPGKGAAITLLFPAGEGEKK